MKKILVLPVKNEEWILEKTLACASLWADHIIIADQNSTDRTVEICKKFPKVKLIKNSEKYHSSNVRKQLLDAAREFEGNNIIFSFDADEIPTVDLLSTKFEFSLKNLKPGSGISFQWINLWKNPLLYRDDGSVWSNSWKTFGFVDDRKLVYETTNVINDHTSRVPLWAEQHVIRFETPKVLHYQFVDWDRMLSKQAYYRVSEFIHKPKRCLETLKINLKYFSTKDESGLRLTPVPLSWINAYKEQGVELDSFNLSSHSWFDQAILEIFFQFGTSKFDLLDIWDINWEQKRIFGLKNGWKVPNYAIKDPLRWEVRLLPKLYPYLAYGFSRRLLRIFKKIA